MGAVGVKPEAAADGKAKANEEAEVGSKGLLEADVGMGCVGVAGGVENSPEDVFEADNLLCIEALGPLFAKVDL